MQFPAWFHDSRQLSSSRKTQPRPTINPDRLDKRRLLVERLEERRLLAFVPAVNYTAGDQPQVISTGDFNNDGRLDLVTANQGTDNVTLRLGNADGTFGTAISTPVGDQPRSIAVGDFDRDGNLDLAVVVAYDGVRYYNEYPFGVESVVNVLFGNGQGGFQAPIEIDLHDPTYLLKPQSLAVGDFNEDGTMDLALASNADTYYPNDVYNDAGQAHVLLSNGDRTFSAPIFAAYTLYEVSSVVVVDFNGDQHLDLLVGTYWPFSTDDEYVQTTFGDGTGNFVPDYDHVWLMDQGIQMVAADLNGDGHPDLVAADGIDVNVRLGDGLGGFQPPIGGRSYVAGDQPYSVVLGDFDRDGIPDVATANTQSNNVSVLRGRGDGTFYAPLHFAAGLGAVSITAGDFNGDGWLDLATANLSGSSVSILVNDQFWPPVPNSLRISDTTVTEGDVGTVAAVFTVMRSGDLAGTTTVAYSTADGGALAGSDYIAGSGTIVFAPGETTKTITILVIGDLTDEWDQGFYVNLSAASSGTEIADGQGFGTIVDNDPPPTITITPIVAAKEGNNGATKLFNFVVSLSAASEKEVRVSFATADGTATTADGDYIARSGTLIFAPGTTSRTISIQVKGDKKRESNERFFVNLTDATNATIAAAQGIGEILDDDSRGKKG